MLQQIQASLEGLTVISVWKGDCLPRYAVYLCRQLEHLLHV